MLSILRNAGYLAGFALLAAGASFAQTASLEGDVKGEDGQPLRNATIKIERKDIKGNYKVKTDKKGHYFHAGLPLGTYKITVEVDGKDRDSVDNVRTRLGDPVAISFDLHAMKQKQDALQRAAETGQLTAEQAREMSAEQRAAMEKQMKERSATMAKNKALNDAFNAAMEALRTKNFAGAVDGFKKAAELDPKQYVVWANMADAYTGLAQTKTGAEQDAAYSEASSAFTKALELKPEDAATHNNYGLMLARAKKTAEAQAELTKAAQLDPPNAGKYYYNLGAVLVNTGQNDAAGEIFKKAIEASPDYAPAQYQYGIYLVSKAQITPDGKVTPLPGTREAFEKYLQLDPNGAFAESARGMIASISSQVETTYSNPSAPAKKAAKKK